MNVSIFEKIPYKSQYIKHVVNINGYHEKLSYRGFFNRLRNTWYRQTRSTVSSSFIKFAENDKFNSYEKFTTEIQYHRSLWDFYDYVGYKHKNRSKKHLLSFISVD